MESEYYWDNDEELNRRLISFNNLDDLEKIKINGLNAKKLLNQQKLSLGIWDNSKTIYTPLYDKFGDLVVEYDDEIIRKIKIVPWKLSKRQKTPEEVYNFISNDIFKDISSFLSYIIKNIKKDIKSVDSFSYQILNDFPKSTDFLVSLLNYNQKLLEKSLFSVYNNGPLHKEVQINTDYSGSQLILKSLINPTPYKHYTKKQHTHETILNKMMFQSAYFMMQASKMVEDRLDKKNKYLKNKTEEIFKNSNSLLNEYDLWSFYSDEVLDDGEIRSKLIAQNNPFYLDIYKIFKIMREIIIYISLIAALRIEKGIDMALSEFYSIYEIWSVAKIWETFKAKGFELENVEFNEVKISSYNLISAKMALNLKKDDSKAKIIWEMHLDPSEHSKYYGGLINGLHLNDKDTKIKPDVSVIIDSPEQKKVLIGDVKFTIKKGKSALPKLESLYKVLSYMEDLKDSYLFKGFKVEGLLIYPGIMDPAKTPHLENENYINLNPLNMFNQDFDKII
ncbi:MAG: hypothetical protein Q8R66_02060 [Methanobacteriaceae archaeon]|nr:hypothetical protein [Methanobacteriaceae archaeon]